MPPRADIAAPDRFRRLGPVWFLAPLVLVAIWMAAGPAHMAAHRQSTPSGVAAQR